MIVWLSVFPVLVLMFAGVFWLGVRCGARELARELIHREIALILAEEDDDEEEGVAVSL